MGRSTITPVITEQIPDLKRLTATEKLLLASELWDEVTAHPSNVPVSQKLLDELDCRMEEFRRDPATGTTWEEAKQRIRASRE
jgi:putative addiction module component (TIGR02574 family)